MRNFNTRFNLHSGDKIIVPKSSFNIVQHYAVYLGYDEWGHHYVAENNYIHGVRLVELNEFLNSVNFTINQIERFNGTNEDRKLVVQKALMKMGKPYDLLNYNCEHFANEITTGISKSPQVNNGIILTVLVLLGVMLFPSSD